MTQRDKDDLAAALEGLHRGDHHEPDEPAHDTSHGGHVHLDGVHEAPAPAASTTTGSSASLTTPDPFEHRKEVRSGKSLPDSSRPVDAPKQ